MKKQELPTEDLKKYGILNPDNSFTKKLDYDEVQKFLEGQALVADNSKNRVVFHLSDNYTKLNVNVFERSESLKNVIENSKSGIQYFSEAKLIDLDKMKEGNTFKLKNLPSETMLIYSIRTDENNNPTKIYYIDKNGEEFNTSIENFKQEAFDLKELSSTKALVFDENTGKAIEYDLIKNSDKLLEKIEEKNDLEESNKFKVELLKLKGYLQDKVDKFPNMAKEILIDLNIVSKTINSIDGVAKNQEMEQKQNKSKIGLDVNDPDTYQDANRLKEQEQREEEQDKKRGFKR